MQRKSYEVQITNKAKKDILLLPPKTKQKLLTILTTVLLQTPYVGEKLIGDLRGYYSFRLTFKDRIVYRIDDEDGIIYIMRARTHYGE